MLARVYREWGKDEEQALETKLLGKGERTYSTIMPQKAEGAIKQSEIGFREKDQKTGEESRGERGGEGREERGEGRVGEMRGEEEV